MSVGFDVVQCEVSFVFMILTRSWEHDKCNVRFDPDLFFVYLFYICFSFLFGCCVFLRPLFRCVVVFYFYFYFFKCFVLFSCVLFSANPFFSF